MKKGEISSANAMCRAFSDSTRLRILVLLARGELCVGDLVAVLKIPQPSVSRHLSYLRRFGLIAARKSGLWSFYALLPARGAFHRRLLDCLRTCFRDVSRIAKDKRALKCARKSGGCCPR